MQTIKIDFDNPGFPQRLDVVENDAQSRFFKAVLYKDGKAYAAPSGATYSIMYRGFGPQNEGWFDTINDGAGKRAACSVSGNVVTCEIARQALRVPGHVSVVLCVTGSNGYMLHGWPIDCNCRNDNYTGGTSVESFFYITQITNADWTSAIQTWEELKNMIDPTLSISGKAADAAKVGEAVGQVKEDLAKKTNINIINVGDYGMKNIPDCYDALNNLVSGKQSITLFFPSGNYIFKKHQSPINLPDNTTILGETGSNISFDDTEEQGANLFSGASKSLSIKNIRFTGRLQTYNSSTNSNQFYANPECSSVYFENVRIMFHRGFSFIARKSSVVKIINCEAYMCCRDVFRFKNTTHSFVYGCEFNRCSDDIVAFHNDETNYSQLHIFTNNVCHGSGGCGYLGCSNVYIYNNLFRFFKGLFKSGTGGSEGVESANINFYNNACEQFLHTLDVQTGRVVTNYVNTKNIYIHDNIFKHNPSTITYSNYITYNGYIKSVTTDNGCTINADSDTDNNADYLYFYRNYVNLYCGPSAIGLGSTNYFVYVPTHSYFKNNEFYNFYNAIVKYSVPSTFICENNLFNGNANNLLKNFEAGGSKFATENDLLPFNGSVYGTNNTLMNVSSNKNFKGGNIVRSRFYAEPVVGVNFISDNGDTVIAWNYSGNIYNTVPIQYSANKPTNGWYYKGYLVRCTDPTKFIFGWVRLTTSNTHTDNDWKELRFN